MGEKQLKILMYPWLAMGHITPYFLLANKLAERGHLVTLLLPNKAKLLLPKSSNLNPSLLTIHPITIPHVEPLPVGTETASDIPFHLQTHLATALDLTRPEFESILNSIQPDLVFYDFTHWVPEVVALSKIRAKCVMYCLSFAVATAFSMVPFREPPKERVVKEDDKCVSGSPPGYPSTDVAILKPKHMLGLYKPYGEGVTFYQRITTSLKNSDVIVFKTMREIESKYCDYLCEQYNNKPVLTVLDLPKPEAAELEGRWAKWLANFEVGSSVVFCAFGSQVQFDVTQFQEILLGFEMTNLPFFVAFKPPKGCKTVEEGFPEGFIERVEERGLVTGEWVQQPQILAHPSVGCFVSHCGSGSIWESLMTENKIVLIPQLPDQMFFSNLLAKELKVVVQVDREEDGSWVSKESLCKAVKSVMDEDSEIGVLVKKNHQFWRHKLLDPEFMHSNVDDFVKKLQSLLID